LSEPGDGLVALLEGVEQEPAGLAARVEAAVDAHAVQLLAASALDLQPLEGGGDVPDVQEGNAGEFAAPLGGDTDTEAESVDHVAELHPAVEALVRVGPHAVHGPGTLGLSEDVLEGHLKVVIDVVGVTVDEVEFGHDDCRGL